MKHILFLACLVLLSGRSNAQLLKNYGVKLAVNSSSQSWQRSIGRDYDNSRRLGFGAALYLAFFDSRIFSLISQLEYDQRGLGEPYEFASTSTSPTPGPIEKQTLYTRLDYLSIPILAKFKLPSGSFRPFLTLGPRMDFLLASQSDVNLFEGMSYTSDFPYKDLKKNVYGASFGVGAEIEDVLPIMLLAEFRYNLDITDSFDNRYQGGPVKVRNNSLDIWLGVAF